MARNQAIAATQDIENDPQPDDPSAGIFADEDDEDGPDLDPTDRDEGPDPTDEEEALPPLADLEGDPDAFDPTPVATSRPKAKALRPKTDAESERSVDGVFYVILEGTPDEHGVLWREVARRTARNAEHAIRQTVEAYQGDEDIHVLAIPERSFRPMVVSVKTERIVTVS